MIKRLAKKLHAHRWLLLLVLLGLLLRLSTLTWGMGLGEHGSFYHADEHKAWRSMTNFPGNYLTNHRFEYGTALQYSLAVLCYPVNYGWGTFSKLYGDIDRIQFNILVFRAVNCFFGAGCIVLTYLLGRKLYDAMTAWLAAGLVAIGYYHVITSPLCNLDVAMSFFVALHFLIVPWAFSKQTKKAFALVGLATGFLVGMKIYAFFVGIIPFVFLVHAIWQERSSGMRCVTRWIPMMLIYAVVAVSTTFVSTPHIFLRFPEYVDWMTTRTELWHHADMREPWRIRRGWMLAFNEMFTPVLAAIPGIALFFSWPGKKHPHFKIWLCMPLLVFTVLFFWGGWMPARYITFIYVMLMLFVARMLTRLIEAQKQPLPALGVLLALFVFGWTARCTAIGISTKYHDARTIAAQHLAQELPEGARLAMASAPDYVSWQEHTWRYPKVNMERYEMVSVLDDPTYIVTSEVNLRRMWISFESKQVDESFNWVGDLWWLDGKIPTREEFVLYHDLLYTQEKYELVKTWEQERRVKFPFIAPEIRLYRKKA